MKNWSEVFRICSCLEPYSSWMKEDFQTTTQLLDWPNYWFTMPVDTGGPEAYLHSPHSSDITPCLTSKPFKLFLRNFISLFFIIQGMKWIIEKIQNGGHFLMTSSKILKFSISWKKYRQLLKCNHKRMTKDFSILFAFRKSKDLRPQQGSGFYVDMNTSPILLHQIWPKILKNPKIRYDVIKWSQIIKR